MRAMTCDEWPNIKYFDGLIILLELIDVSLLILTLKVHNFVAYVRKGGDFLNLIEQNDLVNKLQFFHVQTVKGAKSNTFTCKLRA